MCASSAEKLYLRLERPQFYALFGDYETGFTESQLGAYSRTMTGAKAEYRGETLAATAFVSDTDLNFQRDEIQGNGLSGPYLLTRRDLILNTEKVEYVDWKDVNLLRRFVSDRAKIRARRVTGNNVQQQSAIAMAIKNAREMALIPYANRVTTQRGGRGGRGDRDGDDRGGRRERPDRDAEPAPAADAPTEFAEIDATVVDGSVTETVTVGVESTGGDE